MFEESGERLNLDLPASGQAVEGRRRVSSALNMCLINGPVAGEPPPSGSIAPNYCFYRAKVELGIRKQGRTEILI